MQKIDFKYTPVHLVIATIMSAFGVWSAYALFQPPPMIHPQLLAMAISVVVVLAILAKPFMHTREASFDYVANQAKPIIYIAVAGIMLSVSIILLRLDMDGYISPILGTASIVLLPGYGAIAAALWLVVSFVRTADSSNAVTKTDNKG